MARLLRFVPLVTRRVASEGARRAFPAVSSRRSLSGATFTVDPPEETVWPAQRVESGVSYDLNWSICGSGVVPLGRAFRNTRLPDLAAAGGSSDTSAPEEVSYASVEKQVTETLGDSSATLYVQDCALGTLLSNELPIRIVTDNAAAAAMFKTLCPAARTVPLPEYEEDVTVLHTSAASSSYIASNKSKKTVLMGGSFNAEALMKHIKNISSDAFLTRGVLPLFGSGADNVVYLSDGFASGAAVKHGFSYSSAGFCRLYADDGPKLANSLPMPKAVVMFANDKSGAIPAASVLDAAQVDNELPSSLMLEMVTSVLRALATDMQNSTDFAAETAQRHSIREEAAFYLVGACTPAGMTKMEEAARLMLELGGKTKVYLMNSAAYGSAAEAAEAAKAAVGQTGRKGALGLEVISAGSADQASIDKMAQSLTSAVSAKVKKNDAVLKGGPPLPPPPAK